MVVTILGWIVAGLIVGLVARLLVPGRQHMGLIATTLLGCAGALVGGVVSWLIWRHEGDPFSEYAWPGYLLSIVGAVVVLLIFQAMLRPRISGRSYR